MELGTRIEVVRRVQGLTQAELGQMCLVTQVYISMVERGLRIPSEGRLSDIKTALRWGLEIDMILDNLEEAING